MASCVREDTIDCKINQSIAKLFTMNEIKQCREQKCVEVFAIVR